MTRIGSPSNIPAGLDARLIDVTSSRAVLSLFGPRARDVLAACTPDDVSNAAFPFATCRTISVAGAPVLALRITYVGELGWELHVPTEYTTTVFEALLAAGAPHGLSLAGYRAIETLRLEKGYRAWGAEIGPDHSPLVAGLGWAVKLKSGVPFLGREALVAQRAKPLPRLLAGFTVDPAIVLLGRETIYPRRPPRRLAGERRLRPHARQEHRLRLCARSRRGRCGLCAVRQL